jgi:predicted ATPase
MYNQVAIEGLRGISHLELEDLKRVNLLVGKNNSGKTTVLEAIFLLTGPTNPELPLRINSFRDLHVIDENAWRILFHRFEPSARIDLRAGLSQPPQMRQLVITPSLSGDPESVVSQLAKTEVSGDGSSSSARAPTQDGLNLEYTLIEGERRNLMQTRIFAAGAELNMRRPSNYKEPLNGTFLRSSATVADVGQRFHETQVKKRVERLVRTLQLIEPELKDLSLGIEGLVYCDLGLDRLLPINVMGDGVIRLLRLLLAISETENGIVLVDEIENGLHASAQVIVWTTLFQAVQEFNVQLFATTHSLECVKAFNACYLARKDGADDARLIRIERINDQYRAVNYNPRVLEASLEKDWEVR